MSRPILRICRDSHNRSHTPCIPLDGERKNIVCEGTMQPPSPPVRDDAGGSPAQRRPEQFKNKSALSTAKLATFAWLSRLAAMSSLRMPQSLTKRLGVDTGEAVLRYELLEEQAASLGRMGEKLEKALAALRGHQGDDRTAVLKAAADAAWCFFVQREVMPARPRRGRRPVRHSARSAGAYRGAIETLRSTPSGRAFEARPDILHGGG
jgi:hypothetical protein